MVSMTGLCRPRNYGKPKRKNTRRVAGSTGRSYKRESERKGQLEDAEWELQLRHGRQKGGEPSSVRAGALQDPEPSRPKGACGKKERRWTRVIRIAVKLLSSPARLLFVLIPPVIIWMRPSSRLPQTPLPSPPAAVDLHAPLRTTPLLRLLPCYPPMHWHNSSTESVLDDKMAPPSSPTSSSSTVSSCRSVSIYTTR
jgi:hypothetical protein